MLNAKAVVDKAIKIWQGNNQIEDCAFRHVLFVRKNELELIKKSALKAGIDVSRVVSENNCTGFKLLGLDVVVRRARK